MKVIYQFFLLLKILILFSFILKTITRILTLLWRNNTPVVINKTCNPNEPINITLANIDEGTYIYKIEINDGYGGTVEDEVKVVVSSNKTPVKPNAIQGWSITLKIINLIASVALIALIVGKIHTKKRI